MKTCIHKKFNSHSVFGNAFRERINVFLSDLSEDWETFTLSLSIFLCAFLSLELNSACVYHFPFVRKLSIYLSVPLQPEWRAIYYIARIRCLCDTHLFIDIYTHLLIYLQTDTLLTFLVRFSFNGCSKFGKLSIFMNCCVSF